METYYRHTHVSPIPLEVPMGHVDPIRIPFQVQIVIGITKQIFPRVRS